MNLAAVKASVRPTILIDAREQTPWAFTLPTEAATLDAGDYSIKRLDRVVAVERKTLPDLLACVGRERDRFKRELQRLRAYRFRAVIVEASMEQIEAGKWRGRMKPASVLGSLAAWQAQYELPIMLAGDERKAAVYAERYLFQCARTMASEHDAASLFIELHGLTMTDGDWDELGLTDENVNHAMLHGVLL